MGVPVGVGTAPDKNKIPEEQENLKKLEEEENDELAEYLTYKAALNSGNDYTPRAAPGDKARIVQFINTNLPWKKNEKGDIEDGEIPPDMFFKFYGWFAHNSSMSNLNDNELAADEIDLDIQELEIMMAMKRTDYDPQKNADIRNAKHLAKLRLFQNRGGIERYLSAAEVQEDLKMYKIFKNKQPSRTESVINRVKGREQ